MNIKIIHNAEEAIGIAVIIDVFRAFTVEPYIINNGAKKLMPIGDKEIAYNLKEENNEYILIGERGGIKLPGFDYGNSPYQIKNVDFSNKVVVHTTSCGTQGIVKAVNAEEIITGSLVNAQAIADYIKKNKYKDVSIVSMARPGELPTEEDDLCAKYIKSLLENNPLDNLEKELEHLKLNRGSKFFNESMQDIFPKEDFYLCTEINKFNFILQVNKDENGMLFVKKMMYKLFCDNYSFLSRKNIINTEET